MFRVNNCYPTALNILRVLSYRRSKIWYHVRKNLYNGPKIGQIFFVSLNSNYDKNYKKIVFFDID